MTRTCLKALLFMVIISAVFAAVCAGQAPSGNDPQGGFRAESLPASGSGAPSGQNPIHQGRTGDEFVVNPGTVELGGYFVEYVNNFLVILDASGSKYLPHKQQIKLKEAKDIVRRFNQKTPNRALFGGLRRYGWEAGAFTTPTSLLYGMSDYSRQSFADAIEIVRWAGGKSPLAMAIDKASDDFTQAPSGPKDYLALVIVSDGKILKEDSDPVLAARRIKDRYGDRICIYTVAVGDDLPFDKPNLPENKKRYREKYKLLSDIAKEGKCGYMVRAEDLGPDSNMATFADDVFTRRHNLPRQLVPPPCPDSDGDGVCDDKDKCPGTPRGAPVDENGCWILPKVQFDLNKWDIKPEYRQPLDEVARVLNMNPDVQLAVQGHTCTIWTEDYNMKLSYWRAQAVRDYLVAHGARPEQLAIEGYGFHRPVAPNETEEGRSRNRRAEFRRIR